VTVRQEKITVTPVAIQLDGATVYILEVTGTQWVDGKKHYIVSCQVEYRGRKSNVFFLDVTSNKELESKLRAEIAKMKLQLFASTP